MTKEEAVNTWLPIIKMGVEKMPECKEALDMAIKALEQEPCDDCISRAEAIDAFERFIHELGIKDEPYKYGEMALSVRNVPPATPQPKTGRWKKMVSVYDMIEGKYRMIPYTHEDEELNNAPFYICDCGNNSKKPTNYCSDCGAKMQTESEG